MTEQEAEVFEKTLDRGGKQGNRNKAVRGKLYRSRKKQDLQNTTVQMEV